MLKKEPSDAEFVENLNASFEKERGHKIKIKGLSKSQPSFSELAAKMSKVGAGPMRGKVASSGLKSSGFGVPKILGRRETNPENKFLKPNLKEHLESMDNQENFPTLFGLFYELIFESKLRMICYTSKRNRKKWRNRAS